MKILSTENQPFKITWLMIHKFLAEQKKLTNLFVIEVRVLLVLVVNLQFNHMFITAIALMLLEIKDH